MGLGGEAIEAIGREHAYRPISGDVVFIGRQTAYFTPGELVALPFLLKLETRLRN